MGKELLKKIMLAVQEMKWPDMRMSTGQGRQTYEMGLDRLFSCPDDPNELMAALAIFQSGDSNPFACAGIAHTLIMASREEDSSYIQAGLDEAMAWLEKAQQSEPDIVEINVIEAFIYVYGGRSEDARLVLDYLQQRDPGNYYVNVAEIAYWQGQQQIEESVFWFEQAMEAAVTVPQRSRLRKQLGDYFMGLGDLDKALESYEGAVDHHRDDAQLWHNMSLIYWQKKAYEEAERCNQMALRSKNLPAARKMEASLRKKRGDTGLIERLFGRRRG
jgi:tetratricopeptide (TPR) repeat protein